ncbi:MAG: helix-turn-helix domain-containing protein [Actinomycetota bacterium]
MTSDTQTAPVEEAAGRGRPRDEARTTAILDATNEVLLSKGWQELTVSDIAKAAGCGLATIYRRWDTKEKLVAAAMRCQPLPQIEEVGDPLIDLRSLVLAMATKMSTMGEGALGFMAAAQEDPDLRAAVDEAILGEARPQYLDYLGAVLGQDSPHVELLADSVMGALLIRTGVLRADVDPERFTDEVMVLVEALADRPGPAD